jgi:Family of unknown function (DUF6527)
VSGMMIKLLRKSLELTGIIPRSDLVVRITSAHPAPDQIVPGEMTVVRDRVDKWACFRCPGGCGETIKLSLSKNKRPKWTAVPDWLKRPTVSPSVRQLNDCRCHFWIRQGRVDWCKDSGRRS